jgi:ABC-type polysaccharide/polyol phosphate export permease
MITAQHGFELRGETTPLPRLLRDAWRARFILRAISRRDFFTRYRRPSLGVIWSVVAPIVQASILAVVFTKIVRVQTSIPYMVFVLSGVVAWTFFSATLSSAVRAITGGSGIASKVYFPRCILPLTNVGTNLYGYVPSVVVLVVAAAAYRIHITPRWLMLIPATVVMVLLTSAFALVFAALQVYFRDIAFILGVIIQGWFYGSGVFFPIERVPEGTLRDLVVANPATGMVEMFRVAFMGFRPWSLTSLWWTLGWTAALFVFAAVLYRRYDRIFVDLL